MTDDVQLTALRTSANRLHDLVAPLDDAALEAPAYPTEWSIADVLSHLGSGAVILRRRLDDALAGAATPDDFAPSVWDEWNAKSPRQKADDALAADQAAVDRIASLTDDERSGVRVSMGPMDFDLADFLALRLNEHTLHTWDVAVALDPAATLPADSTELVIDNLALIARFTARPTGDVRTVVVRTTDPERTFTIELTTDAVSTSAGDAGAAADLTLPAEAFARLVYGRLDPDHTPPVGGHTDLLDVLRRVFPGP